MRNATLAVFAALWAGCSSPDPEVTLNHGTPGETIIDMVDNMTVPDPDAPASGPTYYADVKPIIDGRCVGCHVEGEIGPFPLGTYHDVAPLKELISSVVQRRTMPPFLPSPGCNEYTFDPSLSVEQIEVIREWAAAGAPEGDPAEAGEPDALTIPPAPQFDTTIEMDQPYTPQIRPDDYRCFVMEWPHAEQRYVTGFGVRPGDSRIVHHIIAYHIKPEDVAEAERLDAAEDGPGYTCFGGPLIGAASEQSWLGGWAPGGNGTKYPAGTGLPVEPGSRVVIQVHYNTLGTDPVPDKTKIQFETATSVEKSAFFQLWASPTWLTGESMKIPAGDPDVTHRFSLDPTLTTGGRPLTLYSGSIHMHLLGREATTYVLRDDGDTDCLVQINTYDFAWQGGAGFAHPVTINPGDKLVLECTWDNSMANQPVIGGEQLFPEDRTWGEGTTDEMCLGIYYATLADP